MCADNYVVVVNDVTDNKVYTVLAMQALCNLTNNLNHKCAEEIREHK